jgi:hypothetical protein
VSELAKDEPIRSAPTSVSDSLDLHDARHPYLDNDDPEVVACIWCQS